MTVNVFAILDTGHPGVRRAPLHPSDCFIRSRGLFEGTPEAALTLKGPWLARMETYRGFDYGAYVEREYAPHGAATWLTTPLSFNAAFEHLRSYLHVRTTRGRSALLRFWDGAVFQRLTYVLAPEQFAALVGPFQQWRTTAVPKTKYTWDAGMSVEVPLSPAPMELSERQAAMLSLPLVGHVDRKLTREIWHGHPTAIAGREPLAILESVQRAYRYALEGLRLTDLRSIANWVKADAGWAPGLSQQPSVAMRVRSARHPDLCIEDIFAAMKVSANLREVV